MSLVLPYVGETAFLEILVNKYATDGSAGPSNGNRLLRLFTNNLTPTDSTVIGNITECTAAGYSAITLTGSSWTVATVSGVSTASYPEQTFTMTATATVYGYYVTTLGGALLWIERFSGAPFNLPSGGGQISITPKANLA